MGKEDKNPLGRSELHLRCAKQNALPDSNILELIKVGGMDLVMKKDRLFGRTVLHLACSHNASFDLISELVDFGKIELVMEKDNNGNTALHLACKITKQSDASVSLNVITKLIEIGGRNLVMEKNNDGYTALDIAFLDGASPEILAKLLSILSMNYERFRRIVKKPDKGFVRLATDNHKKEFLCRGYSTRYDEPESSNNKEDPTVEKREKSLLSKVKESFKRKSQVVMNPSDVFEDVINQ